MVYSINMLEILMNDNEKYFWDSLRGFWKEGTFVFLAGSFLLADYAYPGEAFKMFRDLFALIS